MCLQKMILQRIYICKITDFIVAKRIFIRIESKVNEYDASFLFCVKRAVFYAVEIYGMEDKAGAIPSLLSRQSVNLGQNLSGQKVS